MSIEQNRIMVSIARKISIIRFKSLNKNKKDRIKI